MEVRLAESESELRKVSGVLLQLRPQYDEAGLIAQIARQRREGYRIAYVSEAGAVLCVAGFVVGTKLAWGRHVYVDDLVTDQSHRSAGAGARLMDWLKEFAREQGCAQIHLDSGVQRYEAHKFYLREGFHIESHHFGLRLS